MNLPKVMPAIRGLRRLSRRLVAREWGWSNRHSWISLLVGVVGVILTIPPFFGPDIPAEIRSEGHNVKASIDETRREFNANLELATKRIVGEIRGPRSANTPTAPLPSEFRQEVASSGNSSGGIAVVSGAEQRAPSEQAGANSTVVIRDKVEAPRTVSSGPNMTDTAFAAIREARTNGIDAVNARFVSLELVCAGQNVRELDRFYCGETVTQARDMLHDLGYRVDLQADEKPAMRIFVTSHVNSDSSGVELGRPGPPLSGEIALEWRWAADGFLYDRLRKLRAKGSVPFANGEDARESQVVVGLISSAIQNMKRQIPDLKRAKQAASRSSSN